MFLSNNSSLQYYCTDQQQQQQPMYNVDRQQQAAFLSDVSPNSSTSSTQLYHQHYPPQCPPHNRSSSSLASSFHFSPAPTFIDYKDYEEYYFPLFHLQQQQHQQQHQDLLVGHHHHFSQQQQQELEQEQDHHNLQPHLTNLDMETSSNKVITIIDHGEGGGGTRSCSPTTKMNGGDTMTIPWKKASKKDRHSKIVTAQGPRDRRMRLSLDIARRFFKLQDMLKFDKASKTVEWLLTNSKGAIKELSRSLSSSSKKNIVTKGSCSTTSSGGGLGCSRASSEKVSSVSECEVVCDDQLEITNVHEDLQVQAAGNKVKKEKHVRGAVRKAPPLAKESRAKARARARERTIEKMRSRSSVQSPHQGITICTSNQLRSSSSFETGEESGNSQSQDMRSSLEMVAHEADDLISSQSLINECRQGSIVEESFVVSSNSMRSSLFDYDHEMKTSSQGLNINNNCNFSGNWDFHNVRAQCNYYSMPNNVHDLSTDFHFMN